MGFFHWPRLLNKYRVEVTLWVHDEGTYKDGLFIDGGEKRYIIEAAIISQSRSAANTGGGNYAVESQTLYTMVPIPYPLERTQVEYLGNRYRIVLDRDRGNAPFTGVYAYRLTWVSKFERGAALW